MYRRALKALLAAYRFLVQAAHDRFTVSEESHALAWVPAAGLGALTDEESVLRMARKWLARRAGGGEQPAGHRSLFASSAGTMSSSTPIGSGNGSPT